MLVSRRHEEHEKLTPNWPRWYITPTVPATRKTFWECPILVLADYESFLERWRHMFVIPASIAAVLAPVATVLQDGQPLAETSEMIGYNLTHVRVS